jgi:hypothetical protein
LYIPDQKPGSTDDLEARFCQLALDALTALNEADKHTDGIRAILELVRDTLGFEAVAIRLAENGDFPYYTTEGFPEKFVILERSLCHRDGAGKIECEPDGRPLLECMCGTVIRGRTDPSLEFFSSGGSFWSGCTTNMLASTSEKERQSTTRNQCNGWGYESVALIPLRSNGETIGLLQLNDRRKHQFTPQMIDFLERFGAGVGIAVARLKSDEARRMIEERIAQKQKLESLGRLAGGVAHDFNNLLAAILGNAELALADTPCFSPARESLDELIEATKVAGGLSRQLLAYAGHEHRESRPIDLSELVEAITGLLEVSISKKQ